MIKHYKRRDDKSQRENEHRGIETEEKERDKNIESREQGSSYR